jgi:hypothetical protein
MRRDTLRDSYCGAVFPRGVVVDGPAVSRAPPGLGLGLGTNGRVMQLHKPGSAPAWGPIVIRGPRLEMRDAANKGGGRGHMGR